MALNGSAQLSGSALQLTNLTGSQIGSAWFATPVNVQSFTTDFKFQDTAATADGFTFTIQNSVQGRGALGHPGGGLGIPGHSDQRGGEV